MAYQLQEINRRIQSDVKEFLAECDENYNQRVSLAADKILSNIERSPIVLLSGPSGSGKTTTAMKIAEELQRRGVNTHAVAMDNYFTTINPRTAPRTPEGDIDYESPQCLDMELLSRHFTALSNGEEILIPKYEFVRQMRNDSRGTPLKLGKNEIAIFEGIHALNDQIAGRHPQATKLYISPFKNKADIIFDSSLPYEVSVMKNYALPLLRAVPEENDRRSELLEFIDAFRYFQPIDPELVAKDSLLREFIGGGSYSY